MNGRSFPAPSAARRLSRWRRLLGVAAIAILGAGCAKKEAQPQAGPLRLTWRRWQGVNRSRP